MADTSQTRPSAGVNRRPPSRLQRRAPSSLQISPAADWKVAIPLLSPLATSPSSPKLIDRTAEVKPKEEPRQMKEGRSQCSRSGSTQRLRSAMSRRRLYGRSCRCRSIGAGYYQILSVWWLTTLISGTQFLHFPTIDLILVHINLIWHIPFLFFLSNFHVWHITNKFDKFFIYSFGISLNLPFTATRWEKQNEIPENDKFHSVCVSEF